MKDLLLSLLWLWAALTGPQSQPPRFGQAVRSPEMLANGKAVFRFKAQVWRRNLIDFTPKLFR